MRVEVYPDGAYNKRRTYNLPPPLAAVRYPHDVGAHAVYDLVVVPVDDEARALTGWQVDQNPDEGDSPQFMLFKVKPKPLEFDVQLVDTFRPVYALQQTAQNNDKPINKTTVSLWLEKEHSDGSWECIGPYGTAPRSPIVELDDAALYAFTGFYDEKNGAPKPECPTYFGACPFPTDASPDVCTAYNAGTTTHPNHWRLSVFDRREFQLLWASTSLGPIIQRALAQGPAQRLRLVWWVVLKDK